MIQQVRRLAREARPVLAGGGDHRLDRLLADLLGDLGHPVSEQPRRVGPRRLVAGALGDRTGEPRKGAAGRLAEASGGARVTGWSLLAHDVQHRVAIAVHADVFDGLRVPGGRAFLPQLAARAAAVVGPAGRARPLQRLAVGVRHHQHLACERALRDDGDESIVPEAHGLNPIVGGGGHPLNLSALARIVKIPAVRISLRPMGWVASLGVLGLMMALLHRLTAGRPVEARATLALGFLLLAALAGGDLAKRVRLPRITGALLIGFATGPAWLGLIRRDEVDALQLVAEAAVALIALAAGAELTLETVRAGRALTARRNGCAGRGGPDPVRGRAPRLQDAGKPRGAAAGGGGRRRAPARRVAGGGRRPRGAAGAVRPAGARARSGMARGGGVPRGRSGPTVAPRADLDRPRRGVLPRERRARRERAAAARVEPQCTRRVHHLLRPGGRRARARHPGPAVALGAAAGGAARGQPALRPAGGRAPSRRGARPCPPPGGGPFFPGRHSPGGRPDRPRGGSPQ